MVRVEICEKDGGGGGKGSAKGRGKAVQGKKPKGQAGDFGAPF